MGEPLAEAHSILDELIAGSYESVFGRFDEVLQKGLPVESLRSSWETVVAQCGPYQSVAQEKSFDHEGMDVVLFALQFETAGMLARIVFQEGRIAGLHFSPVPPEEHAKFGLREA